MGLHIFLCTPCAVGTHPWTQAFVTWGFSPEQTFWKIKYVRLAVKETMVVSLLLLPVIV